MVVVGGCVDFFTVVVIAVGVGCCALFGSDFFGLFFVGAVMGTFLGTFVIVEMFDFLSGTTFVGVFTASFLFIIVVFETTTSFLEVCCGLFICLFTFVCLFTSGAGGS